MGVPEGDVLQFGLELPEAEAVGEGREDLQRFPGDLPLLLRPHRGQRPHVVEPVRELHDYDPVVVRHRDEHLPQVLRLLLRHEEHLLAAAPGREGRVLGERRRRRRRRSDDPTRFLSRQSPPEESRPPSSAGDDVPRGRHGVGGHQGFELGVQDDVDLGGGGATAVGVEKARGFGFVLFAEAPGDLRELGDLGFALDDLPDVPSEALVEVLEGDVGIFDGVVEQAGGDGDDVRPQRRQEPGDFDGVDDVGLARLAELPRVRRVGHEQRVPDGREVVQVVALLL
mmetsp:Transcript_35687/g.114147  ORF Transcript_35687/g.114147 Transcript_35687/m.114147 type:complete len:283 (-) Transcript_35687:397-1245(-)